MVIDLVSSVEDHEFDLRSSQIIQPNLYIKGTQGNLKCVLYEQLSFIYRFKLYALFINGENEAVLNRQ
jgi:hypothetical protein